MRYAIYFAADAEDPLTRLGNSWLGRDPFKGLDLETVQIDGFDRERLGDLTSSPRRYGFHGTLKAPFNLAEGKTEAELLKACDAFARTMAPFEIKGLGVNRLGRFLALTPEVEEPGLSAFAGECVRFFEPFRAPLAQGDLYRRRQSGLTSRQDAHLVDWGYPYIFEDFRFHMTLSNKLEDEAEASILKQAAEDHFKEVTGRPRLCRHFAVYSESHRGAPFQIEKLFELSGTLSPLEAQEKTDRKTRKENA
ncbi:MAG: DUF1045 domain-containing protein [Roseibium sp.]|uniref:DUF1045 domain-containing protein n=1 Tax=Roseibium sp. TaxID=1936156 RepID=UPI001B0A6D7C|nr:DUF1045 domain-containing protein [Roseibium sp.]MBO6892253.1 DUF1045 domain-containing protein [Roseibium sp.]MBO6932155.1 DUF1045 domain-containing protein [Roseibium sp.]